MSVCACETIDGYTWEEMSHEEQAVICNGCGFNCDAKVDI